MSTSPDEIRLIRRTQQGDTEAFSPLVAKYHPRVHAHINGRVRNLEVAKDLTQETWLKAYRGIKNFRFEAAFSSWLYRIAENVCLDYFRRQPDNIEPLHAISEHRTGETHPCPSQEILRQELRSHLLKAIAELPPMRQAVFLLYYHENLSIKAIAMQIGRSEGTIKTHLRQARLQLQESLTPYLKNQRIPWLR